VLLANGRRRNPVAVSQHRQSGYRREGLAQGARLHKTVPRIEQRDTGWRRYHDRPVSCDVKPGNVVNLSRTGANSSQWTGVTPSGIEHLHRLTRTHPNEQTATVAAGDSSRLSNELRNSAAVNRCHVLQRWPAPRAPLGDFHGAGLVPRGSGAERYEHRRA
jgi:hypothetical protein